MSALHHYILPAGNVQIAFSGGRTSAYMLHQILEANGDLPDRCEVTFQNTGREMPQTLDFVAEVGRRWGVEITWLEYRPDKPFFEIVGRQGASMEGEPFEALIKKRNYLPNQQTRFCTIELKIRTAKRFLMSLGWKHWTNCVGIRADEPHRLNKPKPRERWTVWTPLADADVGKQDVAAFWKRQPFDLQLPNVRGNCWLGNCDGCFLKSEANVAAFTRDYPERAEWWERMETLIPPTKGDACTFSKRYSRAEMREYMERQGDWALSTEGALCQADDGECTG
ncbi:phosphoadenosine phosphosulfate reductase domain-containing protein [Stappia indica]|uniref:phosphoadenosine phosphosulfate reductase domain-containing protein n=1 Tax=Stappia indica TaxID=538381 RepID=UPI001CD43929|nr:phosphoadenosine phosphosulfate reductase family protein [Stappia indica]MCA1298023.1 phosphoadenosine phosphosulfate reductase family protein [Stappia indica]